MPNILSFPGKLPEGTTYGGISGTMDFYATAAAIAGVQRPAHLVGEDLMPLLSGKAVTNPDKAHFWNTHGSQIIRWKQWRLVKFRDGSWRLYDIVGDPDKWSEEAARQRFFNAIQL
jgi:arylsulfatase A-like enzyme